MSDTDSVRSLSDAGDSDSSGENESLNKGSDNGKAFYRQYNNNGPRREKTCLRGFRQSEFKNSLLSYRD